MRYFDTFRKQHIIYKIMTIFLVMVIAFFLFRVVKNTVVGLPYPNELLEPANVQLTNSILNGKVPYSKANIVQPGMAEPPVNYEYPFLNSVFAAAFSIFTGGNTVASHYLVSFLAMIGTAVLGSIIIFKQSRTTVGATMGFLLLMFCHWRYGYISASPDGFGLMVTMITLYLACRPGIKYRGFWCAIGTVASFYSKQYYAAVCVSVFIYFFIYMRREALRYFIWCVCLLLASVVLISTFWPLFWTYSILCLYHGCFQGWNMDGMLNVLNQMKYLAFVFAGMIVVLVAAMVQRIRKRRAQSVTTENTATTTASTMATSGISALPLFLIQIPVQMLVLFVVARNDGAYLTYFLQLLIPSLCIATLILMEQMEVKSADMRFMACYGMLVLFTVYFGWGKLPMHMLTDDEVDAWQRAYAIVDEYREKGDVLHSRTTAYYGIELGDSVYGTDHDGDVSSWAYEEYQKNSIQQLLFPDAGAVYEENLAYRDYLRDRLKNHEIAMVAMTEGWSMYATEDDMVAFGYKPVEEIVLQMGNMPYNTQFWAVE